MASIEVAKEVQLSAETSDDELLPAVEPRGQGENTDLVELLDEDKETSLEAEEEEPSLEAKEEKEPGVETQATEQRIETKVEEPSVEDKEEEEPSVKAKEEEEEPSTEAKQTQGTAPKEETSDGEDEKTEISGEEAHQKSDDSGFGSFTFEVGGSAGSSDEDIVAFDADNLPSVETEELGEDDPFYMRGEDFDFARTPSPGKSPARRAPFGSPRVEKIVDGMTQLKDQAVEKVEHGADFFNTKAEELDHAVEAKTQEFEAFVSAKSTIAKENFEKGKQEAARVAVETISETERAVRRDYEPLALKLVDDITPVAKQIEAAARQFEASIQEFPDTMEALARSSSQKFDEAAREAIESSPRMQRGLESLETGAKHLEKKVDAAMTALATSPKVQKGLAKVAALPQTSRDLASEFAETTRVKASKGYSSASKGYSSAKLKAMTAAQSAAARVGRNKGGA